VHAGVRERVHLVHHQRRFVHVARGETPWPVLTPLSASEKCQQEKRKTVNGEDILFAMTSLGFENYAEALKIYLAKYRDVSCRGSMASPGFTNGCPSGHLANRLNRPNLREARTAQGVKGSGQLLQVVQLARRMRPPLRPSLVAPRQPTTSSASSPRARSTTVRAMEVSTAGRFRVGTTVPRVAMRIRRAGHRSAAVRWLAQAVDF
jgi:hypothetical protein